MNINNSEIIISQANKHISNINKLLKDMKSDISADFICSNNKEVIITTNKAVALSDLNIVKKYIKELNNINSNDIISPQLSQFKLYFKILGILYFLENINLPITFNIIEIVTKNTHISNDIVLAS